MRTRMYGGVAGEAGRPVPLCRFLFTEDWLLLTPAGLTEERRMTRLEASQIAPCPYPIGCKQHRRRYGRLSTNERYPDAGPRVRPLCAEARRGHRPRLCADPPCR